MGRPNNVKLRLYNTKAVLKLISGHSQKTNKKEWLKTEGAPTSLSPRNYVDMKLVCNGI